MELAVKDINGKDTGRKVVLEDSVFAIEPNNHAIWLAVKQFMANQRQGTHASKHRGIVSGSTRKLKKQKGTGGARAGSIKNPLFRGGGRIFGPEPRDYSFKLNKKMKRLARLSALSVKAKEQGITVVEDIKIDAPKTKVFASMLGALGVAGKSALIVTAGLDNNVYLSSRNLPKTTVMPCAELNTYAILANQNLVVCEGAVAELNNLSK